MKKFIAAVALVVISAGAVLAADTMTLPAKNGNITFHHKMHQDMLKDCKICHEKGPGKIEGFGKDFAHKTCKGCHADKGKGPTKCSECHKK
jgi:opacity protein-like surface antigen